jgi:hypothetical protein
MRALIASMLSSEPERSWFRIAKASLINSTRPWLTSAPPLPFFQMRLAGAFGWLRWNILDGGEFDLAN